MPYAIIAMKKMWSSVLPLSLQLSQLLQKKVSQTRVKVKIFGPITNTSFVAGPRLRLTL